MEAAPPTDSSILVVDDDFDIREMLTLLLEQAGYTVMTRANGHEALTFLQTTPTQPNLILLDLMMPIMNGVQLHAALQKHPRLREVPIIVLSADPNVDQQIASMHVAGCLKKPLRSAVLLQMVAQYLV